MNLKTLLACLLSGGLTGFSIPVPAQTTMADSTELPYAKIYAQGLDADDSSVLVLLNQQADKPLTAKSRKLKEDFLRRFGYEKDKSDYLSSRRSALDGLLKVYVDYWRLSLLQPKRNYDSLLTGNLSRLFSAKYKSPVGEDSLDDYCKALVKEAGYITTGFARTGKLLDLLVWKTQQDTTYTFYIKDEKIEAPVTFLDSFLTLGWEEYATLGRNYPGGWATNKGLYVVKKAYKLDSENFLISYLAHEGKHFSDYKVFPKLSGTDLEYRAKLIELSLAKETLYKVLGFFLDNANAASANAHAAANFYVVRDLSRAVFNKELEPAIERWKEVPVDTIQKAAYALYEKNTRELHEAGAGTVSRYIM